MAFTIRRTTCPHRGILCLLLLLLGGADLQARPSSPLVTFESAARSGLQRAWFAQIRVDQTRHRVQGWRLANDQLLAVTSGGTVHALDATTGKTLWATRLGRAGHAALGPAANSKYVAVISGSQLHLLARSDGHLVWSKSLGGAPAAGPALSESHAYVALANGRIEAHQLDDPKAQAWFHQSAGKIFQSPTFNGAVVTWPNDQGHLYVAAAAEPKILFRLETSAEVIAPAVEKGARLYVASLDGFLYCVNHRTRDQLWRASVGYQVRTAPAAVGKYVFVASESPAINAVDATTGDILWTTEGVAQFAAMGKQYVFGMDRQGMLLGLDRKTGKRVSRLRTRSGTTTIINDQTDRIFLIDDQGLVQCLHETGADEPIYYRRQKPEMEEEMPEEQPEEPATEEESPFELDGDNPADEFNLF